jgi:hypothetical protein
VSEVPGLVDYTLQVPLRIALWAEELAAHIVIDADNLVPLPLEMQDGFRPDQPTGTCY